MRRDLDSQKQDILELLEKGWSRTEVCKKFKCKYDTLKVRLDKWGCDLKNQGAKGRKKSKNRLTALELSTKHYCTSSKLKKRLFEDNLKKRECEKCGIVKWNDLPAPLELDHINGNRFDNRLENLQILCPNCHAQQPTNSGLNIGSY